MSREIDALIAEKVMGLVVSDGITTEWDDVPHYSTDIAAAWEVYQRCFWYGKTKYQPGDCLVVCHNPYCETKEEYWVAYMDYDHLECFTRADTAPMAICLAALKAKGIDVEALTELQNKLGGRR